LEPYDKVKKMTLRELKKKYSNEVSLVELDILFSFVSKKSVEFLLSHSEFELTRKQEEEIKKHIIQRCKGIPIAYIIGSKEFFGINFLVNKNVLIPRPETELLVEEALDYLAEKNLKATVLDVGTGSGVIIISLSKNTKENKIKYLASDVSKEALSVAMRNSKLNKQENRIKFFLSDLLESEELKKEIQNIQTLLITANLPYVSDKYLNQESNKETIGLKYEPRVALAGGKDGLEIYKKLTKQILKIKGTCTNLKITLFYEIDPEQKTILEKWLKKNLPESSIINFIKDISKKYRLVRIII